MHDLICGLLKEMESAEEYYDIAKEHEDLEYRRIFKELAMQKIAGFEKMCQLYMREKQRNSGMLGSASVAHVEYADEWYKYFKDKAEKLKSKLNTL